ncbi:zinc-binding alcohol dehydrogenase [Actinosynnema sp. NPDC047251]|uniref:L-threonine 3-dehydrogenase n=1 Tax=Saccharothrix espanaensis (strain ATCC 51144 / DSM 44229 / JCM 9112 / NBRC 15066 / NRRL 15764) TaxID=1179773 RepID=K0K4C4_SACES|nr:zinc-binding alcohol dehydrogenase [Saccharothrix espanaensis]CCH31408.1 L-threonine 3-dehydrogenase [Saccharothrix espanaensis DSM 44229]
MTRAARALWFTSAGKCSIRSGPLPDPGPGEVLVRTLHTAVSRGTETLVLNGSVPANQHSAMRAPFQEGGFPFPVKYGYLNVGVVEQGPAALLGRTVFCLYPHQTRYVVPDHAVTPVPDAVPAQRAVLAGTVETAVNALWDARPMVGDRIAVVGGGMVGCSVAALLARLPGARVQLVDVDPARRTTAAALGVDFATPEEATGGLDLVVHASASEAGLETSLGLLRPEGVVLELSWYGARRVGVALGEHFHSRRLSVRASQVGVVGRPDRTHAERLALALDLLADPAFDALITGASPFDDLPAVLPRLASGDLAALCHRIDYGHAHDR